MYESPIDILIADIQHQIAEQQDEQIYKAVVSVGINVDKEELIRALQYDRQQYELGYADGKVDAMAELVRCEKCRFCKEHPTSDKVKMCTNEQQWATECYPLVHDDDFCSYGERRNDV